MTASRSFCLLAILLFAAISVPTVGQEWTRFRGPNGTGVSTAQGIPLEWTADDYNWVTELPGEGHSSPVIWGERLFVTSADAKAGERYLLCLNTNDGEIAWKAKFAFKAGKKHNNNSFATCTPCCDAERVYVLLQTNGGTNEIYAFDHAGKQTWKAELGSFRGGHGSATSPILVGENVIIADDQTKDSSLIALDSKTGEEEWRTPRETKRNSYSTPCVYAPKGRDPEIIFTEMHHGITAVNPKNGKVNWEISVFGTFKQRAIASPLIAGDLVIGLSGFTTAEKNAVAVRPLSRQASASSEGMQAKEVWRVSKFVPHLPTPVIYDEKMFLWTDRGGILTAIDIDDGSQIWQKRIGGNFSGSPVCVDGKLYCADDDGLVYVVGTADEYEEFARNDLGRPTRATPAVSGGRMFWRTYSHVYSLGGKDPAE